MKDGSLLLLVVYDQYIFSSDEFVGMCALSCGSVPFGDERKVEHLPLFQFSDVRCQSLKELESRSEDVAIELCKLMKTLVVPEKVFDKFMKEGATFADKLGLHFWCFFLEDIFLYNLLAFNNFAAVQCVICTPYKFL